MIGTIGSLVQETSQYRRWFTAMALYIISSTSTSVLLGLSLSIIGSLCQRVLSHLPMFSGFSYAANLVIGLLAIGYALSDVGFIRLIRPRIWHAVPVTWWRNWHPYTATLAYGAALGLGVMTRVQFGSFYIICVLALAKGDFVYGMLLLGAYGLVRALTLVPVSKRSYAVASEHEVCIARLTLYLQPAKQIVASLLVLFGVYVLLSLF